jgi:hypothetical protein
MVPEKLTRFSLAETPARLLNFTLCQLGIPPLHVVTVRDASDQYHYYELSADEDAVLPRLRHRPGAAEDGAAPTAGFTAADGTPGARGLAPVE